MTKASAPRVTVAISTLAKRADKIELPQAHNDLTYLILVQDGEGLVLSDLQKRQDVQITFLSTLGLSHSRNAAIRAVATPYILFSDDDIRLFPEAIRELADKLDQNQGISLGRGWRKEFWVRRSRFRHRLYWWNSGQICAPEMMLRCHDLHNSAVRFDPNFGLGACHGMGEEFIFLCDLKASGCTAKAFPIVVGSHPNLCTGLDWSSKHLDFARKAILRRVFPRTHRILRVIYAIKFIHKLKTLRRFIQFLR